MQHATGLIAAFAAALGSAGYRFGPAPLLDSPSAETAEAKHPTQGSYPEAGNFWWMGHGEAMPLPLASLNLAVVPVRNFDQQTKRVGNGVRLAQFHLEETLFAGAPSRLPRLAPLGRAQPEGLPTEPHPYVYRHALAVIRHRDSESASAAARDKTTPTYIAYDASPFLRRRQTHLGAELVSIDRGGETFGENVGGPKNQGQKSESAAARDRSVKEAAQALALILGFMTAVLGFIILITTEGALCRVIGLGLLALAAWMLVS